MSKTEPYAYYNSAFGEYPMSFFPKELVETLVKGTQNKMVPPCGLCGRGGGYERVLTGEALDALDQMERLCYEDWLKRNE